MAKKQRSKAQKEKLEQKIIKQHKRQLNDCLQVDILRLYLGHKLIKLAKNCDSPLTQAIRIMRINIAEQYGFVIPVIRTKTNLNEDFPPNGYEILLKDIKIGEGKIEVGKFLAISSTGEIPEGLDGIPTKDPVFKSEAMWIDKDKKDEATAQDCLVVDASSIIATHISELAKRYVGEILTYQDVWNRITMLKDSFPALVKDTLQVPLGVIHQVLKDLLSEKIPIKDIIAILETIIKVAPKTQNNPIAILDYVHSALSLAITNTFKDNDGKFKFFTLPAESENYLLEKMLYTQYDRYFKITDNETQKLVTALMEARKEAIIMLIEPILIVDIRIRYALAKFVKNNIIPFTILTNDIISENTEIKYLGEIKLAF